jgi:hypothetical protein
MPQKLFIGPRVRRLREAGGMRLEALAAKIGLSQSYLSQIETNQRPVTARVLIALMQAFQVDAASFDVGDDERLLTDLREASVDAGALAPAATLAELKQVVQLAPGLAAQFLALHRSYRHLDERVKVLDEAVSLDERAAASALLPYEEVRDYFHYRDNYVASLDEAAEVLASNWTGGYRRSMERVLAAQLLRRWGVRVSRQTLTGGGVLRRFDPSTRVLDIDPTLTSATRTFQLAYQLALLEFGDLIEAELNGAAFKSEAARDVCRVGLGNYAAGALLLPYGRFRDAAREHRHDVEVLQAVFQVSFEQVCHRLSTLQRPGARGIPFYFVRVDQAGNITKRHSATRFQFARFGGACPLWNVHEAFGEPGRILVQIAEMPDQRRYLCVARSIIKRSGSHARPHRRYALGLGCEIEHADALVYADGLNLSADAARIGVSCRICPREDCVQRAFPPVDRVLRVPTDGRAIVPYEISPP